MKLICIYLHPKTVNSSKIALLEGAVPASFLKILVLIVVKTEKAFKCNIV